MHSNTLSTGRRSSVPMLRGVDITAESWAAVPTTNGYANCYCAKKNPGILFSQVSDFKDASF